MEYLDLTSKIILFGFLSILFYVLYLVIRALNKYINK